MKDIEGHASVLEEPARRSGAHSAAGSRRDGGRGRKLPPPANAE